MYVYVDYLSHSHIVVVLLFSIFLSNNNNLMSMIKKCVSVKIIYIGLQIAAICGTYDGFNRLNNEILLEEKSKFHPIPTSPLPSSFLHPGIPRVPVDNAGNTINKTSTLALSIFQSP